MTTLKGLPVTTPARTLLDLARFLGPNALERAFARLERAGITNLGALQDMVERHPGQRGIARLRRILELGNASFTRSEAEARFLSWVRKADLPKPKVNAVIAGLEVDFVWMAERLVAETDGFDVHGNRAAFEWDHRRDAVLLAAGFRVMRVTWSQLVDEPVRLMVQLAQALAGAPIRVAR